MGGRGARSRLSGGTSGAAVDTTGWQEAFDPGVDYESSGDVDHVSRTVTRNLQRRWDSFSQPYQSGLSQTEEDTLYKDWDPRTNEVYGYFRTTNSMAINHLLNDPNNDGKTDAQIFVRKPGDRHDYSRDLKTVQTLDRAVASHKTQADAYYLRYCNPRSLKRAFNLTDAQVRMLQQAGAMTPAQLQQLSANFAGNTSFSKGYTSTSANRSMNAFKNPHAPQSQGYIFERRLYAPAGTNAYAPRNNAQESEVLFGRKMHTRMIGVSYERGHVVIHEMFDRYD